MKIRNNLKYAFKLPGRAKREAEIDALLARFEDPEDPYRGACWAISDKDAAEVDRDVE